MSRDIGTITAAKQESSGGMSRGMSKWKRQEKRGEKRRGNVCRAGAITAGPESKPTASESGRKLSVGLPGGETERGI